jgi:3-phenylpropionate/trans-cinnamate dioxygenase ferredoxin subunit
VSEFELVSADDLAPGELRAVLLADGTKICLGNARGELFAVRDRCPHAEFPLSDGELDGKELICAWHGARFDCTNGDVLRGPADEPLALYPLRVNDGAIWVRKEG